MSTVLSGLLGAGSSVLGGILGSGASKSAAGQIVDAQGRVISNTTDAVDKAKAGVSSATVGGQSGVTAGIGGANDVLTNSQQQQRALYQPYMDAGLESLGDIRSLAGAGGPLDQKFNFNPSDLQNDPGYAFTLKQGQDAIQRAAASRGGLFSGSTLKSLAGYTTGTANQYFNDAFSRAQSTYQANQNTALARIGTLQGLAGFGYQGTAASGKSIADASTQQAQNIFGGGEFNASLGLQGATTQGQQGLQGAQVVGNAISGQGNARAAGTIGSANAWSGALSGGSNAIQDLLARRKVGAARNGG